MRAVLWVVVNAIFSGLLYYGIVEGVTGARNVALFVAWFTFVASFSALSQSAIRAMKDARPSVPVWLDRSFDVAVAGFLLWHGYWFTGTAYAVSLVLGAFGWAQVEELRRAEPA